MPQKRVALLLRRWYIILFAVLLTAGLGIGAAKAVSPTYTSTANILLVPPNTDGTNPYLALGGLGSVGDVLATDMSSAEVNTLLTPQLTGTYTVATDPSSSAAVMVITGTGKSVDAAVGTMRAVVNVLPARLLKIQQGAGVTAAQLLTSKEISVEAPVVVRKSQQRAIIAALALGLVIGFLLLAGVENISQRRTKRREAKPGKHSHEPLPVAPGYELLGAREPLELYGQTTVTAVGHFEGEQELPFAAADHPMDIGMTQVFMPIRDADDVYSATTIRDVNADDSRPAPVDAEIVDSADDASLPGASEPTGRASTNGHHHSASSAANGHATNGHDTNGHHTNGHHTNGHSTNGHHTDGHGTNGHAANGHSSDAAQPSQPDTARGATTTKRRFAFWRLGANDSVSHALPGIATVNNRGADQAAPPAADPLPERATARPRRRADQARPAVIESPQIGYVPVRRRRGQSNGE